MPLWTLLSKNRYSLGKDRRFAADINVLELFARLINYVIILFTLVIFARVILSFAVLFIKPPYPPMLVSVDRAVNQITEPVLAPIRRLLPSFGGLDFSPMVVIIVLMVIREVLAGL